MRYELVRRCAPHGRNVPAQLRLLQTSQPARTNQLAQTRQPERRDLNERCEVSEMDQYDAITLSEIYGHSHHGVFEEARVAGQDLNITVIVFVAAHIL